MRCEVVAIGTELLLGQIIDTNSSWIGEQLAMAGIDSHFQTKVGDNLQRIIDSIQLALSRSDAVICCGGLGPTQDDITREAIASVMGVGMQRHDDIAARIRHIFESRGRVMADNNLRQADVPIGASTIPDQPGTAPGLICPIGDKVLYAVPGVPYEMHAMMDGTILPDLKRRAGLSSVIASRTLRTWGHSESRLAELLAPHIEALEASGNPTLAFLASGIEGIKVRITAKAADEAGVARLIADEEARVREVLGHYVFGIDDETMESVVLDHLRRRGQTLAIAEVTSGGIASQRLSALDGDGMVFQGGVVASAGSVRERVLGVAASLVGTREAAAALAGAVRAHFGTDIGLATTGEHDLGKIAGTNAGTTYLGIAIGDEVRVEEVRLPGDRKRVREFSVISLLNALRLRLELETWAPQRDF
ncbi:MAG: CinA family nicotinamide mononucleotide deamidase-related protein [Proteobacteria bacterium]|nr:CinA family nicotinamide mononucleotide deamidase-related protein [Pseudomonadota bacterium]